MAKDWKTKLIHSDAQTPEGFRSLAPTVYRGSTVLFDKADDVTDRWNQYAGGYTYGVHGTPTSFELAGKICELEGGHRTMLAPGGQAAISMVNLAMLSAGDHILIPETIYGPNRRLAKNLLRRFGVESSFYSPLMGAEIESLLRDNTRLVWCESPGSITMEVQDVPAIAKAAHARGVLVVIDNTWSSGVYFEAFKHGVDISVQALTKYIGGHSDLLLGSITVRDPKLYDRLGATQQLIGSAVSPDDCALALRGMKTLAIRLKAIEAAALELAHFLKERPEVAIVLHPALPSCPGHELWKRDFTGATGVFSIVLQPEFTKAQVHAFVDALELFEIGFSWGGVNSLAVPYDFGPASSRAEYGHSVVRLNIGLEDVNDLRDDLTQALEGLRH